MTDVASWLLLLSVWCGPWELVTVLPSQETCQAVADTARGWQDYWEPVTLCVSQGTVLKVVDPVACSGY